jgi:hypothetical protein
MSGGLDVGRRLQPVSRLVEDNGEGRTEEDDAEWEPGNTLSGYPTAAGAYAGRNSGSLRRTADQPSWSPCIAMPEILHVELVERTAAAQELRLWRDNANDAWKCTLALSDITELVALAEADYAAASPGDLRELGRMLFRWLDGGERRLSAEIAAAANRTDVLVLAVATSSALAHLPWEALHDDAGFLVHAINPPVLPVRWRPTGPPAHVPANRPLQAVFMAASPWDVLPLLDFGGEEHQILMATRRWPMNLVVEESGSLEELGVLLQSHGPRHFDVLHLTGHAGHAEDGTPVFLLEDDEGRCAPASARDLGSTLPHRPPLVFLSGCRTGQRPPSGEDRSLAEQLIEHGFHAVLGWARRVSDSDATVAARFLYAHLAGGDSLPLALARAHARLRETGVPHWHMLRLFAAGDPPAALVTPLRTPGRRERGGRPAEAAFLDHVTKTVRVATRAEFVGRRRVVQDGLCRLRRPDGGQVGVLLHGPAGCGKSSVAARLCDRLRVELQRVVVIGWLDEPSLVDAWAPELPGAVRDALRHPSGELRLRIESALLALASDGCPAPLFVLDGFERNQPAGADGDLSLHPEAARTLGALLEALEHSRLGRAMLTGRYPLPDPYAGFLHPVPVPPAEPGGRWNPAS